MEEGVRNMRFEERLLDTNNELNTILEYPEKEPEKLPEDGWRMEEGVRNVGQEVEHHQDDPEMKISSTK
jgi:hypothetical protein